MAVNRNCCGGSASTGGGSQQVVNLGGCGCGCGGNHGGNGNGNGGTPTPEPPKDDGKTRPRPTDDAGDDSRDDFPGGDQPPIPPGQPPNGEPGDTKREKSKTQCLGVAVYEPPGQPSFSVDMDIWPEVLARAKDQFGLQEGEKLKAIKLQFRGAGYFGVPNPVDTSQPITGTFVPAGIKVNRNAIEAARQRQYFWPYKKRTAWVGILPVEIVDYVESSYWLQLDDLEPISSIHAIGTFAQAPGTTPEPTNPASTAWCRLEFCGILKAGQDCAIDSALLLQNEGTYVEELDTMKKCWANAAASPVAYGLYMPPPMARPNIFWRNAQTLTIKIRVPGAPDVVARAAQGGKIENPAPGGQTIFADSSTIDGQEVTFVFTNSVGWNSQPTNFSFGNYNLFSPVIVDRAEYTFGA